MIIREYLNLKYIDAILVALVLSVNSLRFFLGIHETSLSLYMIYGLCIIVLFHNYSKQVVLTLNRDNSILIAYVLMSILLVFCFLSASWIESQRVLVTFAKFSVSLTIAAYCISMPEDKIRYMLMFFLIINTIYAGLLLLYPQRAIQYMLEGSNYLSITLTIGLSLTISLIKMFEKYNNNNYKMIAFWLCLSTFYFVVLTGFAARGVLLFPPIIVLFNSLLSSKGKRWKSFFSLFALFLLAYIAFQYYMQMGGSYSTARFMRLFEDTEDESRIPIWNKAVLEILNHNWYLLGGGVDAFKYSSSLKFYPHNIFIHLLGEYGIWGLLSFIYLIWLVIKRFIIIANSKQMDNETLSCVFAGFLYYLMTFNKSFSLYDTCPLFIMIALCLSFTKNKRVDNLIIQNH